MRRTRRGQKGERLVVREERRRLRDFVFGDESSNQCGAVETVVSSFSGFSIILNAPFKICFESGLEEVFASDRPHVRYVFGEPQIIPE